MFCSFQSDMEIFAYLQIDVNTERLLPDRQQKPDDTHSYHPAVFFVLNRDSQDLRIAKIDS
ncbi:MAG: hypothetical protein BWK80_54725 [Desulfobacteraceae bacterium IS3]|nr:MAG: hypothetical protein BWK80_54725 [Desulfobacteraceae bacterium IS3]HAO19732.1 hypothetical protein [Desulfobacteraceae bacterium]